jgi:hypothetical protein
MSRYKEKRDHIISIHYDENPSFFLLGGNEISTPHFDRVLGIVTILFSS